MPAIGHLKKLYFYTKATVMPFGGFTKELCYACVES